MTYSKEIKKLYSQLLGKSLKTKMNEFELQLIETIISTILTASCFKQTFFREAIYKKLDEKINQQNISDFVNAHQEIFLNSLAQFFPAFLTEETSFQITERLTEWLTELVCIVTQ